MKHFLNWLWKRNPITRVLYADIVWELKVIGLSLITLFVASLPALAYFFVGMWGQVPDSVLYFFSFGAVLSQVGFLVGLVSLVLKHYQ